MHCVGGYEALLECTFTRCVAGKTDLNGTNTTRNESGFGYRAANFKAVMAWDDL